MNWEQICNDPVLRNLPYKIETDGLGKLILSPAKNIHSFRQGQIMRLLLQRLSQGHVLPECAIETPAGVKVADVAWITAEHWTQACDEAAFTRAPALCIEVWSSSNTEQEIADKRALYTSEPGLSKCGNATRKDKSTFSLWKDNRPPPGWRRIFHSKFL